MLGASPSSPTPKDKDTTPGPPPAAPPDGALPHQPTDHTDPDPEGTPPPPAPDGRSSPQVTRPLDWLSIRGSTISECVYLGWADSDTTKQALDAALRAGTAALGPLYALATLPHSPLAFRLWRATPGPKTPWFHEGALDGIVMDYMMKTRASSGLRNPTQHGTLLLQDPSDLHLLAGHCQTLGILPLCPVGAPPTPSADYWSPAHNLTPQSLLQYQDPALPYTCFVPAGSEPSRPGIWGQCYSDSRLPQTLAFTWDDLQVLGTHPNYCRHDQAGFSPIVVEVPSNEVERIRWGFTPSLSTPWRPSSTIHKALLCRHGDVAATASASRHLYKLAPRNPRTSDQLSAPHHHPGTTGRRHHTGASPRDARGYPKGGVTKPFSTR